MKPRAEAKRSNPPPRLSPAECGIAPAGIPRVSSRAIADAALEEHVCSYGAAACETCRLRAERSGALRRRRSLLDAP